MKAAALAMAWLRSTLKLDATAVDVAVDVTATATAMMITKSPAATIPVNAQSHKYASSPTAYLKCGRDTIEKPLFSAIIAGALTPVSSTRCTRPAVLTVTIQPQ